MIHFVTIALDAQPFIGWHIHQFNKLKFPFTWSVAEGVAEPVSDTSWVKRIEPRLSNDGTTEYLRELAHNHPRVTTYHNESWQGKTAMFNRMLADLKEPGLLFQVDADEIWMAHQIETIWMMFQTNLAKNAAMFHCDYLLGPNIRITSKNTYGNHDAYEWIRVWRFEPGMKFKTHEPPVLVTGQEFKPFTQDQCDKMGLVFTHPAYCLEKQVAFKQEYYQYPLALESWRKLQSNTQWPTKAKDWLHWITDEAVCDQIVKV